MIILTERNEPEEGVGAEDSRQILAEATVKWLPRVECAILLAALFAELDRCEAARDEVHVERQEGRDDEGKD